MRPISRLIPQIAVNPGKTRKCRLVLRNCHRDRVHGDLWNKPGNRSHYDMEDNRLLACEEDFVGNWNNSRDFCKDIHISVKVNDCRIEGCK